MLLSARNRCTTSGVSWCVIVMQKPLSLPAPCSAAYSAKLVRRGVPEHSVQAVRSHGALNRLFQTFLGTVSLPPVYTEMISTLRSSSFKAYCPILA
jgi:hypothetical protein